MVVKNPSHSMAAAGRNKRARPGSRGRERAGLGGASARVRTTAALAACTADRELRARRRRAQALRSRVEPRSSRFEEPGGQRGEGEARAQARSAQHRRAREQGLPGAATRARRTSTLRERDGSPREQRRSTRSGRASCDRRSERRLATLFVLLTWPSRTSTSTSRRRSQTQLRRSTSSRASRGRVSAKGAKQSTSSCSDHTASLALPVVPTTQAKRIDKQHPLADSTRPHSPRRERAITPPPSSSSRARGKPRQRALDAAPSSTHGQDDVHERARPCEPASPTSLPHLALDLGSKHVGLDPRQRAARAVAAGPEALAAAHSHQQPPSAARCPT